MLLARGVVIPGGPAERPTTEVMAGGSFQGSTVKAESCTTEAELDCAVPIEKADVGQTTRSTGKSELKSLFEEHPEGLMLT